MALHIPTLMVASVFVFLLIGLLTCHAWLREPRDRSLAYMAAMMLLAALGAMLVGLRGRAASLIKAFTWKRRCQVSAMERAFSPSCCLNPCSMSLASDM